MKFLITNYLFIIIMLKNSQISSMNLQFFVNNPISIKVFHIQTLIGVGSFGKVYKVNK